GKSDASNPIYVAQPDQFKFLEENYPSTSLQASGISVGLPWGEVGNSEVGHLTIGAGKVIYQHYPRIMMAIQDKTFFDNPELKAAFAHARKNNSGVNFVGLLSKGNVHSAIEHIQALIKMAELENVANVKLHLFGDGKDYPPKTIDKLLAEIPQEKISSIVGRYYGMDRESNWRLTEQAYGCITGRSGAMIELKDLPAVIQTTYEQNLTEEHLPPYRLIGRSQIEENDAVIFFNYREDSIRQIVESFVMPNFDKFPTKKFENLHITTMTHYKDSFKVPVAFPPETIDYPIGKVLSDAGLSQLRLAESYKYAHITYFFNGFKEPPFPNEYRVLVPSEPIPHPDEHPKMMAPALTERLVEAISGRAFDFILVNYANGDTIAHTGNYDACIEAVKIVNEEIGKVIQAAIAADAYLVITSDHGNMEEVISPITGLIETQHDASPVPFYLVAREFKGRQFQSQETRYVETSGILSDVAPTILELMNIPKPSDMNGESMLKNLL
ncbi:MAG: 2,3-bisphosphoglycerate-independent phosphoglycerate mutase, partial [bacterium]|nr:2,3-bisphosphoglycerate-independent phosphoglycerate mutase [bacterium]